MSFFAGKPRAYLDPERKEPGEKGLLKCQELQIQRDGARS